MANLKSLFQELSLDVSQAQVDICLYRSGFLDSADLLQLLLLIEQSRAGTPICLEEVLSQDITLKLLESLLVND